MIGLDLSPRGTTTIDLMGWTTVAGWSPWGSTYAELAPATEAERAVLGAALDEARTFAGKLRTKAAARAVLDEIGGWYLGKWGLPTLRTSVQNALIARWFPRVFVNARADGEGQP